MPWHAALDPDKTFIRLTYSGVVTPLELSDALTAAVALSRQHGCHLFLADCSDMIGGHSISDLYSLITLYESVGLHRDVREALVLPSLQSSKEEVFFYETACLNRGYLVKVFLETGPAITWLLKHPSPVLPSSV